MKSVVGRTIDFIQSRAAGLRGLYEDVTTSLWFRPMFWLVGMGALATGLIALDQTAAGDMARDVLPQMLLGDTDSVRTMLGAIVGAMLTVMSISFTLMMSTVMQAANAYTPRLLRKYIGDAQNQHVLGVLVGTFLYSVLVLYSIRGGEAAFVPVIASNVALLFSIISIIAFIYFLNHTASSIKVGSIIALIVSSAKRVIQQPFRAQLGEDWKSQAPYQPPSGEPHVVCSNKTGYLQIYEFGELFERAVEKDVTIKVLNAIGDFLLMGTPVMHVWPAESADENLLEVANSAYVLNRERTESQDIYFGIRQLSDIALRALSPGINDPSTAINTIHSLASLLSMFLASEKHSHVRCDAAGVARIVLPEETFQGLLSEAYVQLRHYGKDDFMVIATLIEMAGKIAYSAENDADRDILWKFITTTMQEVAEVITTPTEREYINQVLTKSAETLNHNPQPYTLALNEAM